MSRLNLSIDGDDAMSPTSDSPKAKSNTKPKSSPANRRSATFTYDGEEIPRDDLCDMLDKIYKTHDETQAKRSKCHTELEELRQTTRQMRQNAEAMLSSQLKYISNMTRKVQ